MPLLAAVHTLRTPNPSPRSSIPQEKQSDVDVILKGLKTCSTRLRASMSSFADEFHLLERVYYKSKNQHLSSIFFKRVSDVRRYGYRLSGLQLPELVAELRAAFFGTNSKKLLKGAWNQCPDVPFVKHIALRLGASVKLLNHMKERIDSAYRHLALAMQSGAFVQLILLLVGMTSRMAALVSSLHESVTAGQSLCGRMIDAFELSSAGQPHASVPGALHTSGNEPDPSTCTGVQSDRTTQGRPTTIKDSEEILRRLAVPPTEEDERRPDNGVTQVNRKAIQKNKASAYPQKLNTQSKQARPGASRKEKKMRINEIDGIFGF